jgi:hypothetical protein
VTASLSANGNKQQRSNVDMNMKRHRQCHFTATNHKSTPVARRISSTRFCDSVDSVKVNDLNNMLDAELQNAVIGDGSHLVENIFPNQRLPFTVDQTLLDSLTTVYSNDLWITLPTLHQEPAYATWMNEIGLYLPRIIARHPILIK